MTLSSFSGRLDLLEAQMAEALQKLLLRIDFTTMSNFQNTVTTQLNEFDTAKDNHETRIDTLEGLYTNLAYDFLQHTSSFTGHTGQTGIHFTES
ncbi:MAG: hypothetical protein ACXABY_00090 [Candidatus Thorarchaeota archaeon]|jgi:hypothetical protein